MSLCTFTSVIFTYRCFNQIYHFILVSKNTFGSTFVMSNSHPDYSNLDSTNEYKLTIGGGLLKQIHATSFLEDDLLSIIHLCYKPYWAVKLDNLRPASRSESLRSFDITFNYGCNWTRRVQQIWLCFDKIWLCFELKMIKLHQVLRKINDC